MDKNWQNDPRLADMDKSKLEMLQNLAEQGTGKNASDMLPFLMNAASRGKSNGLNFSSGEISAVLEVLKMGKSPQEAAKIDRIVNLMQMIGRISVFLLTPSIIHSLRKASAWAVDCSRIFARLPVK